MCVCMQFYIVLQLDVDHAVKGNITSEMSLFTIVKMSLQIIDIRLPCRVMFEATCHLS